MLITKRPVSQALIALALGSAVTACGGMPENRTLYSTKQPVVERTTMALDVSSGRDGINYAERQRIDDWFQAMNLRYGDRVAVADPYGSSGTFEAVEQIAARYGILVSGDGAIEDGTVTPGRARVVVTRSSASVPGCPDWSAKSGLNYNNAIYPNYGCAVHSNLAAMVANPEDLVQGQQGTGETVVLTSTKAIDSYREQEPTGTQGLKQGPAAPGGN